LDAAEGQLLIRVTHAQWLFNKGESLVEKKNTNAIWGKQRSDQIAGKKLLQ